MLVGAYPFERPEDKHDNQKLQKMIQVLTVRVFAACRCGPRHAISIALCFILASRQHDARPVPHSEHEDASCAC